MIDLLTGMYSRFTEMTGSPPVHNPLYLAVNGRMFNTQIPETAGYPNICFQLISHTPSRNLGPYFFETVRIQFDIFSKTEDDAECQSIYSALKNLYDYCTLTVANNTHLYMRRELVRLTRESEPQASYWRITTDFTVMIEHVAS